MFFLQLTEAGGVNLMRPSRRVTTLGCDAEQIFQSAGTVHLAFLLLTHTLCHFWGDFLKLAVFLIQLATFALNFLAAVRAAALSFEGWILHRALCGC